MSASFNKVLILFGPTASGKSSLAMSIAQRVGGTIINADSMQVYSDLRVLTARPSVEDEAQIPHRLYGTLDADDPCTAARWRAMAEPVIRDVLAEGRLPILCGGTGFYLRALTQGLSPIPPVDQHIREKTRRMVNDAPVESWERLEALDPTSARRIEPMDRQRVARALEVYETTGKTLTHWLEAPAEGAAQGLDFIRVALDPPRDWVRERCDLRLDMMVENGALEEVAALSARGLVHDRPALRAVGMREFGAYLENAISLEEALIRAKAATRQYAKRQKTWLKNQFIAHFTIYEQLSENNEADFFAFIQENGLQPR